MCLAVPAEIVEHEANDMLRARVGKSDTYLSVSGLLLERKPAIGEYIIIHAGFALRTMDTLEAEESLRLLREMSLAGGAVPNF